MDDGIKQLLDSEDMTNLKLAIIISGDIEGIADYIIMMSHKRDYFSLIDRGAGTHYNNEFMLYGEMYSSPNVDYTDLSEWKSEEEIRPLLIDHLNKIVNE